MRERSSRFVTRCDRRSTSCSTSVEQLPAPLGRDVAVCSAAAVRLDGGQRRAQVVRDATAAAPCAAGRSPRARGAGRAPRPAGRGSAASATTPVNDSRNFSRSAPRLRSPGSATTKPNAVSIVGDRETPRACPARAAPPAVRAARGESSRRSRATCSAASDSPARATSWSAPATVRRQTPRSPSESHSCTSALRSVTAGLGVLDQLDGQGLEQRRVGRAAAGQLLRLAQPREQDAAGDRDDEVDHERDDRLRRLDRRRVVRVREEEVERQPGDDRGDAGGDRARPPSLRAAAAA